MLIECLPISWRYGHPINKGYTSDGQLGLQEQECERSIVSGKKIELRLRALVTLHNARNRNSLHCTYLARALHVRVLALGLQASARMIIGLQAIGILCALDMKAIDLQTSEHCMCMGKHEKHVTCVADVHARDAFNTGSGGGTTMRKRQ